MTDTGTGSKVAPRAAVFAQNSTPTGPAGIDTGVNNIVTPRLDVLDDPAQLSGVGVTVPTGGFILGPDGTVGGPGGTQLTSSVENDS